MTGNYRGTKIRSLAISTIICKLLKKLVAGGGFEPPIPLCGIMCPFDQTVWDQGLSWRKTLFLPFVPLIQVRAFSQIGSSDVLP